jgi:hypothetical protein
MRGSEAHAGNGPGFVQAVVADELARLHRELEPKTADVHNLFLVAVAPRMVQASADTRRITSRLGNTLGRIARRFAAKRYGDEAVPAVLVSPLRKERADVPSGALVSDTRIYTHADRTVIEHEATRLIGVARTGGHKIGSPQFRELLNEAMETVANTGDKEDHHVEMDLVVMAPTIGLTELKAGGDLDTSNAPRQIYKLLRGALAYNVPDTPVHFACLYANRGEGQPIGGALRQYLTDTGESPGLLAGSAWWERVLPEDVTFHSFVEIFREVGARYEIVPGDPVG